jgi:hypothetical protein
MGPLPTKGCSVTVAVVGIQTLFYPRVSLRQNQAPCPFKQSDFFKLKYVGCEMWYMLLALHRFLGIFELVDAKKYCLCHLHIILQLCSCVLIRQSIKRNGGSLSWLPAAPCYLKWMPPIHQCNKLRMLRERERKYK